MRNIFYVLFLIFMVMVSCRKNFDGENNQQLSPETFSLVDSVRRDSNNLLSTTVIAHWWGQSKTGFIKGFETSIDNQQTWQYTDKQTGTFLLNLPIGFSSGNLPIFIRAIDNIGQKDPTPAIMVFPVRNSPPTLVLDFSLGRRTKTFPAFRYNWITNDVDGIQDIQSIEIILNDTNNSPFVLIGNANAASFVASVTNGNFDTTCWVYQNTKTTPLPTKINGLRYNQLNKIYIRAVDRVGAKSGWVKDSVFVKLPQSDLLLVNDYSTKKPVQDFYRPNITNLGARFTNFDSVYSIDSDLPADVFTIIKTLDFYKRIVWFGDNPNSTLGLAQLVTQSFFQQGGRMFMVCEMTNEFPAKSDFFSFTPVQELVTPPPGNGFRIDKNEIVFPHIVGSGWPILKTPDILSVRPFVTITQPSGSFTYDSVYRANLVALTNGTITWNGTSNVLSSRIKVSTGKPDFLFTTLPLHKLNGNNNMDSLFKKALITELLF